MNHTTVKQHKQKYTSTETFDLQKKSRRSRFHFWMLSLLIHKLTMNKKTNTLVMKSVCPVCPGNLKWHPHVHTHNNLTHHRIYTKLWPLNHISFHSALQTAFVPLHQEGCLRMWGQPLLLLPVVWCLFNVMVEGELIMCCTKANPSLICS